LVSANSWIMGFVFFIGGFYSSKNWLIFSRIYDAVFAIALIWILALSVASTIYKAVPFEMIITGSLNVWINLAAFHGWSLWRYIMPGDKVAELVEGVIADPENLEVVKTASRICGRLILPVVLAASATLWVSLSLPYELLLSDGSLSNHLGFAANFPLFPMLHARSMWPGVLIVVASLSSSIALLGFVSLLHILELKTLRVYLDRCSSMLTRWQLKKKGGKKDSDSTVSAGIDADVSDLQANLADRALEDKLFRTLSKQLSTAFGQAQRNVDVLCDQLSTLWLHLLVFSMTKMAVGMHILSSRLTGILRKRSYEFWWTSIEIGHFVFGFVVMIALLFLLCSVSSRLQKVPSTIEASISEAGCPSDRMGSVLGLMSSRPAGMNFFNRMIYIDVSKAMGVVFVLFTMVVTTMSAVIEALEFPDLIWSAQT